MSTPNIYRSTPRQVTRFLRRALTAGQVPFVQSSPGVGKSSLARLLAKEFNLLLIDHRMSAAAPEDQSGLPRFTENGCAEYSPFEGLFPLDTTPLPIKEDGSHYDGWLLLLDEFNSATKLVMASCYKLLLDKMVGQRKLHPNVAIMLAGNLAGDRAIVNPIGTALQSRAIHLEMEVSFEEWLYDVALPNNYDNRIIAYLSQYPSKLMDFRPEHTDKTFCCPRTWEFMNSLIYGVSVVEEDAALYAGTITSAVAVDFIQFTRVFDTLVSVEQIVKDPLYCQIPSDGPSKWATISTMMEKSNSTNFGELCTYANRFPLEFRILFFRSAMIRLPSLRQHPAFVEALVQMNRYLNG